MRRTFKYKAVMSRDVADRAMGQLGLCCELYNAAVEERRGLGRLGGVPVSRFSQIRQIKDIRQLRPEFQEISQSALEDVVTRVDRAFAGFFRRVKAGQAPGYPRFKSRHRYDSLTLRTWGWKLAGAGRRRRLTVQGIGTLKLYWSRDYEGTVKTVTIRRDACGDWWVTFSCEGVPARDYGLADGAIGIDVGLESYLTTSDGAHVANPRPLQSASAGLRKAQRVVAKRTPGGARRGKAVKCVASLHRKVQRVRRDFQMKLARSLVQRYALLGVEGLNVRGLARSRLARQVNDVAWGEFLTILTDKAAEAGRTVIAVDPRGTSQVCSECGVVPDAPKPLSQREHRCPCGYVAHRDVNAARNILYRAVTEWAGQALQGADEVVNSPRGDEN